MLNSCLREGITLIEREAQLKFADDIVPKAAAAKVLHTDGHAVDIFMENLLEILGGPLVDDEHRLPFVFAFLFFIGKFPFPHFDIVFPGQPA